MPDKYSIFITAYEYDVLKNNHVIALTCKPYLVSAVQHDDDFELHLTLSELKDLIGFVAAEANHARLKRNREDLNEICDYLESEEIAIERG